MRKFLLGGAFVALAPIAAFAQTPQDLAFVQSVTHVDLVTITESQNAGAAAANPAVRDFAAGEVRYHTDENHTMASMLPPTPPTTTPCMTWQSVLVQRTAAPTFDPAYLQATIYNHTRLVAVFQGEMQNGNDPNLKAFAAKALPDAQAHLAAAQQLLNGAPVAVPSPITVRPRFASGQWSLTSADQGALGDFAHHLTGMQQVTVTATGYTDTVPIGPELKRQGVPTNQVLSEKRAESVKQYLVSQGLRPDQVQTQGMGPADPVASNATEAGRAQNRRVVVAVTGGAAPAPMAPMAQASGIPSCWD